MSDCAKSKKRQKKWLPPQKVTIPDPAQTNFFCNALSLNYEYSPATLELQQLVSIIRYGSLLCQVVGMIVRAGNVIMNAYGSRAGCLRHRARSRFFVIYEDFQQIAKGPHQDKVAALLRILEVKTDEKFTYYESLEEKCRERNEPAPARDMWMEVSYNDFASWSLNTIGRSSFQIADKEAEKLLLIKSRVRHKHVKPEDISSPLVPCKEYLLIRENVQALLDGKEIPVTKGKLFDEYDGVTPVIPNTPPVEINTSPVDSNMPHVDDNTSPLLKSTCPPVEINTHQVSISNGEVITNKTTNKGEERERDAHASAHAQSSQEKNIPSFQTQTSEEEPQEPAQQNVLPLMSPPPVPVVPAASMPWSAEKLVQYTEARRFVSGRRGAYFSEVVRGKSGKSERDRQLAAAKRILENGVTEKEYVAAYEDQNDNFWNSKGSFTVEVLAGNSPRRVMYVLEFIEKLASRSTTVGSKPAGNVAPPSVPPMVIPATMTRDEAEEYKNKLLEMTKDKYPQVRAKVMSQNPDAWYVRVKWEEKENMLHNITNIKSVEAFTPTVVRKLSALDALAAAAKEAI